MGLSTGANWPAWTKGCAPSDKTAARATALSRFFVCRTRAPRNSGANPQSTCNCAVAGAPTSMQNWPAWAKSRDRASQRRRSKRYLGAGRGKSTPDTCIDIEASLRFINAARPDYWKSGFMLRKHSVLLSFRKFLPLACRWACRHCASCGCGLEGEPAMNFEHSRRQFVKGAGLAGTTLGALGFGGIVSAEPKPPVYGARALGSSTPDATRLVPAGDGVCPS